MIGTVEDREFTPTPATNRPRFTLGHADGMVAIYKHTGQSWTRIMVLKEGEQDATVATLEAAEATVTDRGDITHLLGSDGQFPDIIRAFTDATAVGVLTGEVAALRRRAEAKRFDAGMSDLRHDNGAGRLDARADAIEHAISVFRKYGD